MPGVKTSLNYAKLTSGSVIQKPPSPRPFGSLWHSCFASWLPALPWLWLSPPYPRLCPYSIATPSWHLVSETAICHTFPLLGLFFSGFWMLGGWAILNQPVPAKPACFLLAWESGQDGGRMGPVQRGDHRLVHHKHLTLTTLVGQG